jgi:hypothetical protein
VAHAQSNPRPGFNVIAPAETPTLSLTRIDTGVNNDTDIYATYLTCRDSFISMTGQSVLGRVMYHQSGKMITFSVMQWRAGPVQENILVGKAQTLDHLRAQHPREFRVYLVPLLAKLSDLRWLSPAASDYYAAFPEIPADPAVVQRVNNLLPDLDSDSPETRDRATRALLDLGPPGALAALRLDASLLSEEQKGRLARLVSRYRNHPEQDPLTARRDVGFLLDAFDFDDPRIRSAAHKALEQRIGHPIAFDENLPPSARGEALDELRFELAMNVAEPMIPTQK